MAGRPPGIKGKGAAQVIEFLEDENRRVMQLPSITAFLPHVDGDCMGCRVFSLGGQTAATQRWRAGAVPLMHDDGDLVSTPLPSAPPSPRSVATSRDASAGSGRRKLETYSYDAEEKLLRLLWMAGAVDVCTA